ncbi:replication initiator [Streptosporangium sp. NPDC048865]|uniref:replication initiator n=1 Tax=Streptosporangium sp. NPDC048865 TaxID=3155766 RepID=UPI0034194E77
MRKQQIQKVITQWPRCHHSDVPSPHHENLARSHFSTKSRHYSTTLGALRQTRADYRAVRARMLLGLPDPDEGNTLTVSEWTYGGSGHRHGEPFWAELARQGIAASRRIARERDQ